MHTRSFSTPPLGAGRDASISKAQICAWRPPPFAAARLIQTGLGLRVKGSGFMVKAYQGAEPNREDIQHYCTEGSCRPLEAANVTISKPGVLYKWVGV